MSLVQTIAMLGWLSVFVLSWMLLLGAVAASLMAGLFWVFFLVVALFASSLSRVSSYSVGRKL